MLLTGKLYTVITELDLLLFEAFDSTTLDDDYMNFDKVIRITKNSEINVFLFVEYVKDCIGIPYCKILYDKKFYIAQGPYHITDKIKML